MTADDLPYLIVGGGVSGLVAARELGRAGHPVVVLEARDRLGGRAWTADHWGTRLEMGATWVHWLQPHVWAEITRYGLTLDESPGPERSMWIVDGELRHGRPDEYAALLEQAVTAVVDGAGTIFPGPHRPLKSASMPAGAERLREIDSVSIAELLDRRRDAGEISAEVHAIGRSFWSTSVSGAIASASVTQPMRLWKLAAESLAVRRDASVKYRIAEGMSALIDAIAADIAGEIRLGADVRDVADAGDRAIVTLEGGEELEGRAAILTVPVNALRRISVPGLPAPIARLIADGQNSTGVKVWALASGRVPPFSAIASPDHPLTAAWTEWETPEGTVIVAFGPDATRLDRGRDSVEGALRAWLPNLDVLEVASHDWTGDPLTGETFGTLRPGQLTAAMEAVWSLRGRVLVGGGDLARGWVGFVDGAIQSGLDLARTAGTLP